MTPSPSFSMDRLQAYPDTSFLRRGCHMKTKVEVRKDSLAPGLQSALDVPSDEQCTQFHWKCFPNRMLEPQSDLSANEMVDLVRVEADARWMGKPAQVQLSDDSARA